MIYCVAIIGPKNSPLYFKTYQGVVVLNMQFVVHAALDVLDEKLADDNRKDDNFLGLLQTTDIYRIWGYVTPTSHKILVVSSEETHHGDIRTVLTRVHGLLVSVYSNPFHKVGRPIMSAKLSDKIDAMVKQIDAAEELARA